MSVVTIIQTAIGSTIGTIFGAATVLLTIYVNARVERRKTAQSWYEQTYITEGVDLILTHFISLQFFISNLFVPKSIPLAETINPVPLTAVMRTQTLLGNEVLNFLIVNLHFYIKQDILRYTSEDNREYLHYPVNLIEGDIKEAINSLTALREELLKIRVKNKHDVYTISKREGIINVRKRLDGIEVGAGQDYSR